MFSLVQWESLDVAQQLLAEKPTVYFFSHSCFRLKTILSREKTLPQFPPPPTSQGQRYFSAFKKHLAAWRDSARNWSSEAWDFAYEEPISKTIHVTDVLYFWFTRLPAHEMSVNDGSSLALITDFFKSNIISWKWKELNCCKTCARGRWKSDLFHYFIQPQM